ncbi:protein phosphatase 1 regulatory subunit 7-like [Ptychodera flava]|uniref:protein phosphatase 1 regulatory subunit 7-like n=1 Tax=Ptychodera flava TaxID=63121 RepID=UPI00396A8F87
MSAKTLRQFSSGRPKPPSRSVSSSHYQRKTPPIRNHQVRSATNGRSATKSKRDSTVENDDSDTEQSVVMIDVPSAGDTSQETASNRITSEINPQMILQHSGENTYDRIYEVDLHASKIAQINNLTKFAKVRILDLSCNYIKNIENLNLNTDLRELKLYGNQITEIKNLEGCKEMCNLLLQHNKIRSIGKGLSNLRKLKMLRLDNNQICKVESRELAVCGQLTFLDISNNRIDNLVSLNCLQCLEELYASENRLQRVTDLSRCKKLQEVDLSNNKLTDISGLKGLPNITTLNLSNNYLSNESVKAVGKLKSLEDLNIAHNQIELLEPFISAMPSLQTLNVISNRIKHWKEICCLSKMATLVELFVSSNPFAAEGGEKQSYHHELHQLLPRLEILDGALMKRLQQKSAPVMRPMSVSTVVSSRQVENQIRSTVQEMLTFESSLASRFDNVRMSVNSLPAELPKKSVMTSFDGVPIPGTSDGRPATSKCSVRSRIRDAQDFASQNF